MDDTAMRSVVKGLGLVAVLLAVSSSGMAVEIVSPTADTVSSEFVSLRVEISQPLQNLTYSVDGEPQGICRCVSEPIPVKLEDGNSTISVEGLPVGSVNTLTDSVTVVADREPPMVSIRPSGTVFNRTPMVTVTYQDEGTGVDPASVSVMLDGTELLGEADGSGFEGRVTEPLEEGDHSITVNVSDNYGRWTVTSQNVTIPAGPVFSQGSPEGMMTEREVDLSAVADRMADLLDDDESPPELSFTVLGVSDSNFNYERDIPAGEVSVEDDDGDLVFSREGLQLQADGRYLVRVQDSEGTVVYRWRFGVDTTPPEITWTSPANNSVVTGEQRFGVTVEDAMGEVSEVMFERGERTVSMEGVDRFGTVFNTSGFTDRQRVSAVAEDEWGNLARSSIVVFPDREAPVIESFQVVPGSTSTKVYVRGMVSDDTGLEEVSYGVNGSDDLMTELEVNTSGLSLTDAIAGDHFAESYPLSIQKFDTAGGVAAAVQIQLEDVIAVGSLDHGSYPVVLRARDAAGREVTDMQMVSVEEGADASLEIVGYSRVSGEDGAGLFNVTVRNTGAVAEAVRLPEGDRSGREGRLVVDPGEEKHLKVRSSGSGSGEQSVYVEGLQADASQVVAQTDVTEPTEESEDDGWMLWWLFVVVGVIAVVGVGWLVVRNSDAVIGLITRMMDWIRKNLRAAVGAVGGMVGSVRSANEDMERTTGDRAEQSTVKVNVSGKTCDRCGQVFASEQDRMVHRRKEH